jgi:DNA-binding response OmpR family regulator
LRQRPDVPVVMLSAKNTEVDEAVSVQLGGDDQVPCGQRFSLR